LPGPCDSYFIKVETERTAVIKPRATCHQCQKNTHGHMMLFSLFKGTFSTAYVKWKNKYVLIT